MLLNYYLNKKVSKDEILQQVQITEQGISILQLEELCEKYGILLESYECSWEEIWKTENNKPIILLLSRFNAYHFVLLVKEKKQWSVYDPIGKIYPVDEIKPLDDWTQIAIFTSYPKHKPKPFSLENPLLSYINNSWSWLFLFTNLLEFLIGLATSYLTSKLFNLNGASVLVSTMWKISFIYLTLVAIHLLFSWLHYWLKRWYFYRIYKVSMFLFFDIIDQKRFDFYKSNDSLQMMQYYGYFQKVLSFYVFFLVDILSESFTAVFCFIFLMIINPWNAILVLLLILGLMIIQVNVYRYNKQSLQIMIKKPLEIQQSWKKYAEFKQFNHLVNLSNDLKNKIENQIIDLYQFDMQNNFKKHIFELGQEALQTLITLFVFLIYWVYVHQISSVVLSISLLQILTKNMDGILKFIQEYLFVKPLYKILKNTIYTNEISSEHSGKLLNEIKTLTYLDTNFQNNIGINVADLSQDLLCRSLLNQLNLTSSEILINHNKLNEFNPESWTKSLVYLDLNHLPDELFSSIFNHDEFVEHQSDLMNLKLAILKHLTKTQQNKLIILNHFFDIYDEEEYEQIQQVFNELNQSNFVIANLGDERWSIMYDNLL